LLRLLRAAALKLRPGGRLVLESVNPHSPLALKHFWIDPTHHHPLFPEVVLALCRISGFASGYIWFPGGSGDAENDRTEQLDYSVVAERAPREAHPPTDDAVSVSTDVGELWYPADCQVLTPAVRQAGTWDPEDGAAIMQALAPGMTVVDVGAHVGYFALLAARCVGPKGKVLAVEPAPGNFALLRANVERAGAPQVSTVNAAAWRDAGSVELLLSRENTGDNRVLGVGQAPGANGAATTVSVPAVKLDDLLAADHVDFVLLDTQGSERAVLEGMRRTIARDRPRLQVEFWPHGIREFGDDPAELAGFYRGLGYELSVLGTEEQIDGNGTDLVELAQARPGGFCTLVLTPRIG
ncbi:MAG: FkbM family methyltransferase, partial [Solirubrobacteraceae bacterium]